MKELYQDECRLYNNYDEAWENACKELENEIYKSCLEAHKKAPDGYYYYTSNIHGRDGNGNYLIRYIFKKIEGDNVRDVRTQTYEESAKTFAVTMLRLLERDENVRLESFQTSGNTYTFSISVPEKIKEESYNERVSRELKEVAEHISNNDVRIRHFGRPPRNDIGSIKISLDYVNGDDY